MSKTIERVSMFIITLIPRLFVKLFRIKHKHHYVYEDCGDAGLAGCVACYRCIWCGDIMNK